MAKIMIDLSGLGGLAPKFYGDSNAVQGIGATGTPSKRYLGAKGQLAQGYWNPFRSFGYMAPPTSMVNSSVAIAYTDASFKQDSELVAMLYDSLGTTGTNGKGVWAASKDSVFYQNSAGNGFNFATHVPSAFVAGTPTITDMEVYQVNGVNKILAAYNNPTGSYGDIMLLKPDASGGQVYTWYSATAGGGGTNLGATSQLVFVPSADNYMYLLDTNNVHRIDGTALTGGTNATVTQGVLIFPAERNLVDGVDFNGSLWLVAETNQAALKSAPSIAYNEHKIDVYIWNRQITTASTIQSIPIAGMQKVHRIYVTPDGDLRLIGIATDRSVQIRKYNGSTFEVMQELPMWAYPPYRKSLGFYGSMTVWQGFDGKMYAHGKLPQMESGTLASSGAYAADQIYILGDMSGLPGTDFTPGVILLYGSGTGGAYSAGPATTPAIIFNYAVGSTYKTYQWFFNGVAQVSSVNQNADAGNVYTLLSRLPGLPTINYIRLWHLPLGSGGSTVRGTFTIYKNQSTSALGSGAVSITDTDIQRGYKLIEMGVKGHKAFAFQFQIAWATNYLLSDTTDWMPYAVEVDYDETEALK